MCQKKFFMFLFMALQLLVAGCGGDEDSPLEGDTPVVEVDRMMMSETLSVEVGKYKRLDLRIEPEGDYKVVWRSEDEDVAVVADGLVVGVSAGETDITASVQGKSVFCRVSVSDTSEEPEDELSLEMEKTLALEAGESHQLVLKVKPESDYDVTWLSSDTDVASVSDEGLVIAVGSGTAKVLAIVENNVAICTVTVDSESEGKTIVLDLDSYKDADAVKRAIVEADVQGVTHYILKGEYSKLGYDEEKADSNPFQYTNAEVIDFSGVANWPWIEFDDSYNGKKIPGVPAKFFYESSSSNPYYPQLRKVIFSDEILGIGKEAFYGYYLSYPDYIGRPLAEVVAPQLIVIKSSAFYNCSSLASIDLSKVQRVESVAFSDCKSLKTVSLPQTTYIGSGAFGYCSSLESVDMPQIKELNYTFSGCSALTSINLPQLTIVEEGVFAECTSLVSVNLPELEYINNEEQEYSGAFYSCTSLQSVAFPKVKRIGNYCFADCPSLETINLPMVNQLGCNCFMDCTSLVSLRLTYLGRINGGDYYYEMPFGWFASESCTLYLNKDKREGGSGSPQVEDETTWWNMSWKEIIFE